MNSFQFFFILLLLCPFVACQDDLVITPPDGDGSGTNPPTTTYNNQISDDRMLIVLSAPSIHNSYYAEIFDDIINFQVAYAETVMGNDNIVVLADAETMPYLQNRLPSDVLLQANIEDIWIRDFSTVVPNQMVQVTYSPSYLGNGTSRLIQNSLVSFTEQHNLNYNYVDVVLDGGNVVDNNKDKAVITERVLEDNNWSVAQAKAQLRSILGIQHIAVIPYDDEIMGHADGMVMWVDDNTVLVNEYDEPFRTNVLTALQAGLPNTNIVEVPVTFDYSEWKDFASACGVNLNSTVTHDYIYTPIFDKSTDAQAVAAIQQHTTKEVKTIDATGVCFMGGSARCLSWQLTGNNAAKLIEAAR